MGPIVDLIRQRPRRVLFLVAATAIVLAGSWTRAEHSAAAPVPLPFYEIRATSGSHHASLLNLPLPYIGAPQIPIPVDVNGDLLPDVLVSVNLIDAQALFNNPPQLGALIAPNIQIDRILTGPLLGQPLPPLRIEVVLQIGLPLDPDPLELRFGYDTATAGSIPPQFKAVLGGLENLFNPLSAVVDTGPSAGRPVSYDGNLNLVGGLSTSDSAVDLDIGFAPLPQQTRVSYGSDDFTQHITYAHTAARDIDVTTDISVDSATGELDVAGRIDRLPSSIAVDITDDGEDGGAIEYAAASDGRRPDVSLQVASRPNEGEPFNVDTFVEALPPTISAQWSLPVEGPSFVDFAAGGGGVGAADIDLRSGVGVDAALPPFVADEEQFLAVRQTEANGHFVQRISGRITRVRAASFDDNDAGVITAHAELGDGELPLQVFYDCAARCSEDGSTIAAEIEALVSPLPDVFTLRMEDAAEGNGIEEPLDITYDASQPTDVEADLRLVGEGASGPDAACGALRTTCAQLELFDLPTHLHATVGQLETDTDSDLAVGIDLDPADVAPDLLASVVLGPNEPGDSPTVADVRALGLPSRSRINVHQHYDDVTDTFVLDSAHFTGCDTPVGPNLCLTGGSNDGIGVLEIGLRNFLQRPVGFPVATVPGAPLFANITQRGSAFALDAGFTDLRDVDFVDNGSVLGVHTAIGDGTKPFAATVDIQGADLGDNVELNDEITLDDATQDLFAEATVTNLPADLSLCFRVPHEALVSSGDPSTARCEQSPFDDEVEPLAIAYDLGTEAAVTGTFRRTVAGVDEDTDDPYSETFAGEADLPALPEWVTAHISLPPEGEEGEINAIYDSPTAIDELSIAIRSSLGDSVCLDPRQTAQALCASARIEDIPAHVEVRYDPTDPSDNLEVSTRGPGGFIPFPPPPAIHLDVRELSLTSVAPDELTGEQGVLILTGEVVGLPKAMHGTLLTPSDPEMPSAIELCASDDPCGQGTTNGRIEQVTLDVRNVVVADPTPLGNDDPSDDTPPQRGSLPDPTDQIVLYQRGEIFHALVDVGGIAGAGYRTLVSDNGKPSGTQIVSLDLGSMDPVIRAFVDLDAGVSRTIADVTLQDVPPATTMCLRGADLDVDHDPVFRPGGENFCETVPTDDEGAFQLATTPGSDTTGLDVDAFIRQSTGGDAEVIAAEVRMTDVPFLVQGTFPAQGPGSLDVRGYSDEDGANPDGFAVIDVEVATFDLLPTADGYGVHAPFVRKDPPNGQDRAPGPTGGNQHLALVAGPNDFNARVVVHGLQQIAVRDGICDEDAVDAGAIRFDTRADHPLYPPAQDPDEHPYSCVRTVVQEGAGQPMDLFVNVVDGEQVMSLSNAQLTAVPDVMELTIASGPSVSFAGGMRPSCAEYGDGSVAVDPSCLPPLVRFDQHGAPGQLFGELRIGDVDDLADLAEVDARGNEFDQATFVDIGDMPSGTGLRARVGIFETGPAAIGKFRFDVPYSLTVDQPQVWADSVEDQYDALDAKFRYVARSGPDSVIPSIGDLKVLLYLAEDGGQILLSGDDPFTGLAIPGEVDFGFYLRKDIAQGTTYMQADGSVSTDLSLRAVILNGNVPIIDPTIAALLGIDPTPGIDRVAVQLTGLPAYNDDDDLRPSFRAQIQMIDGPPPLVPEEPSTCNAVDCEKSQAKVNEIRAMLDFNPPGHAGNRARLLRAVVDNRDVTMVHLAGYDNVNAADGAPGDAEISAQVMVNIDPMSLYIFKGIPFLGNLEVDIAASINAGITIDKATEFRAGFDAIHIEAEHTGTGTQSAIGPIDFAPDRIFGGVQGPFDVTVVGLEYTGILGEGSAIPLQFKSCSAGGLLGGMAISALNPQAAEATSTFLEYTDGLANGMYFDNDHINVVVLPVIEAPLFVSYGLGDIVVDLLEPLATAIACGATEFDLENLITATVPGDPLNLNGHEVPDAVDQPQIPDPPPAPPPLPDGILGPATPEMCGEHRYATLHITGIINVAPFEGPNCPAGSESSLRLVAEHIIIDENAGVFADDIVGGSCDPSTVNYAFPENRSPFDSLGFSCVDYLVGNHGAAHVQDGGRGANVGAVSPGPPDAWTGSLFGFVAGGASEAGWRGGGSNGGLGGGVIALRADRIELNGTLSADGGDGGNSAGGTCFDGGGGGGGGSGGAVLVDSPVIEFGSNARLSADGGDGGDGGGPGGGGGSSGSVLVAGAVLSGFQPGTTASQAAGAGGDGTCTGDPADGQQPDIVEQASRSQLAPLEEFWQTTLEPDDEDDNDLAQQIDLDLGVAATAAPTVLDPYATANQEGYQIILCTLHFEVTTEGFESYLSDFMPSQDAPNWPDSPCGLTEILDTGIAVPVYSRHTTSSVPPGTQQLTFDDGFTLPFFGLSSGYYGAFSRIVTTVAPGNDCLEPDYYGPDPFNPLEVEIGNQAQIAQADLFDVFYCQLEPLPPDGEGTPDLLFGIDNVGPELSITALLPGSQVDDTDPDNPIGYTDSRRISAALTANDILDNVVLSGVDELTCYVDDGLSNNDEEDLKRAVECRLGEIWEGVLRDLDGSQRIVLVGTDQVGNVRTADAIVTLDRIGPDVQIEQIARPDGQDAIALNPPWYSLSPGFRIFGFDDDNAGSPDSGPRPGGHYTYQVDNGAITTCPAPDANEPDECIIPAGDLPGPGTHVIRYSGLDRAGNDSLDGLFLPEEGAFTREVFVDGDTPITGAFAAPLDPDGANGWYRTPPWLGVVFYDPPVGGSSVEPGNGPSLLEFRHTINNVVGSFVPYVGPIQLGAGSHSVCSQARDVAGNPTGPLEMACTPDTYFVDPNSPIAFITANPGAPNGTGGWYVTEPTLTVSAFDIGIGSSSIDPNFPGSGLWVSVDDGPYLPKTLPHQLVVPEGDHVVRAYAVDVAGNRSSVVERTVRVDLSHPVSTARLLPPDPARGPWWRTEPIAVLQASDGDQNAGVATIEYRIDNGAWTTYTRPFTIPAGASTLQHRALDVAGPTRTEPPHTVGVLVDTHTPSPVATQASKIIWSRLLGPPMNQLNWTVVDDRSVKLNLTVIVYDVLGTVVRRLDAGVVTVTPGVVRTGSTAWDGRGTGLALVPIGVYHYRVVATDEAGNVRQSGESKPITIKLV